MGCCSLGKSSADIQALQPLMPDTENGADATLHVEDQRTNLDFSVAMRVGNRASIQEAVSTMQKTVSSSKVRDSFTMAHQWQQIRHDLNTGSAEIRILDASGRDVKLQQHRLVSLEDNVVKGCTVVVVEPFSGLPFDARGLVREIGFNGDIVVDFKDTEVYVNTVNFEFLRMEQEVLTSEAAEHWMQSNTSKPPKSVTIVLKDREPVQRPAVGDWVRVVAACSSDSLPLVGCQGRIMADDGSAFKVDGLQVWFTEMELRVCQEPQRPKPRLNQVPEVIEEENPPEVQQLEPLPRIPVGSQVLVVLKDVKASDEANRHIGDRGVLIQDVGDVELPYRVLFEDGFDHQLGLHQIEVCADRKPVEPPSNPPLQKARAPDCGVPCGVCTFAAKRSFRICAQGDRTLDEAVEKVHAQRQLHGAGPHQDLVVALHRLAVMYRRHGDLSSARSTEEEALTQRLKLHGEAHPGIATSLSFLGVVCLDEGAWQEARRYLRQALEVQLARHGDTPQLGVADALHNLAFMHWQAGYFEDARRYAEHALAMKRQLKSAEPVVARTLYQLGVVCKDQGKLQEALKYLQEAVVAFSTGSKSSRELHAAQAWLKKLQESASEPFPG